MNGCQGIGTGWSTDIPNFNPIDIINNIKLYLDGKEFIDMNPYYGGFTGTILKETNYTYTTRGKYSINGNKLIINELPIEMWTDKYKDFLESICVDSKKKTKKQIIRYYNSYCTDVKVHFELFMDEDYLVDLTKEKLEKTFKLISTINTSNMVLYNSHNEITKFNNVKEILKDYCDVRFNLYKLRKEHIIQELQKELDSLNIKIRFINEFIEDKIKIIRVKKIDIEKQLIERDYPKFEGNYDYLLKMPIYNLSEEKIEEFENKLAKVKSELDSIKCKTIQQLWNEDLNDLIKELPKFGYSFKKDVNKKSPKKTKLKIKTKK